MALVLIVGEISQKHALTSYIAAVNAAGGQNTFMYQNAMNVLHLSNANIATIVLNILRKNVHKGVDNMKKTKKLSLLEKIMNIAAWITAIGSILFAILGFVLFWHAAFVEHNVWDAIKVLAASISCIIMAAIAIFYIAAVIFDKTIIDFE